MRIFYTRIFLTLLCLASLMPAESLFAQTANWSAFLPTKFPTNASGQIHGISRVSQLKFHPTNSNKLYAVSARGGLFISTDAGANWSVTPGTDFMSSSRFASVCIDFTNDQIIYLGAGDHNYYSSGNGVWKTTNGGTTFVQVGLNGLIVVDMIMDPSDHNVIVAATNGGIYKTTNAGSSWTLNSSSRAFDDLKMKANNGTRTLFAATRDSAFFRSTDFGNTWSQINNGIVFPSGVTNGNGCRIAVTPADSNLIYLGMVVNGGMIYKSVDGGNTFTAVKTSVPPYLTYYTNSAGSSSQGDYNFGIGADRVNGNILYLVAHNVWKSTDGGVNWTQLTNWYEKVHTDMHQVITSPYNNNQLYNMNDGGVWLSTDAGISWNPKSDGIYGYEIYHGNCSPTRREMFSIGTQDNGELYANSLGWYTNRGGDWSNQCAFDYRTNSSTVYYFTNTKRRDVTGSEQTYAPAVSVIQDLAFHRSNSNLAFLADTSIYRTINLLSNPPTWTNITNLNKPIKAMHSSFADPNRLYVITNDAMIYVSTNALSGSPTFTAYAVPNTTNNAASITSIKSNPNVVYITCNTKVYRSADNGATWTNITYNLPSVNHVRVLADEYFSTGELVFIASNNTVYYKTAGQTSWTIYDLHLPSRTSVIDLSIYNDSTINSSLRVATYGRGMWETPISNLHALNAGFTADNTGPCPGGTVNFSDISTGSIVTRTWSFPGGTPSTSTVSNPAIVYNSAGTYNVTLTVSDGSTSSTVTQSAYINTSGSAPVLSEGFESSTFAPAGWTITDGGSDGTTWSRFTGGGGYGASTSCMYFDNYNINSNGNKDDIRTFRMSSSGLTGLKILFDVAYKVYSSSYNDSLAVLVSSDCGNTFTQVYVKGSVALATIPGTGAYTSPSASDWRTDTINLQSFTGSSFIVMFRNIGHFGNDIFIDNIRLTTATTVTLNLKAYLEGFYSGSGTMKAVANPSGLPLLCDTITLQLMNSSSPYAMAYTMTGLLQTNGTCTFPVPLGAFNNSYYLNVKHRNSLDTWSALPVSFASDQVNYDFSTAATQAYGNNEHNLAGVYCIHSGDINRDGAINLSDVSSLESAFPLYTTGYLVYDLTGDWYIESSDYSLLENEISLFLVTRHP